jgi:hypothetical protein
MIGRMPLPVAEKQAPNLSFYSMSLSNSCQSTAPLGTSFLFKMPNLELAASVSQRLVLLFCNVSVIFFLPFTF